MPAVNKLPDLDRFNLKYIPEPNSGCWLWFGPRAGDKRRPRPVFVFGGKKGLASRFSYSTFVGPIPSGMMICHRCHNKDCVNPDHLYAGTALDNTRDMFRAGRDYFTADPDRAAIIVRARNSALAARRRAATHCKHGHLLSGTNLYLRPDNNNRVCRTCAKARASAYSARKAAKMEQVNAN